MTIGGSWLLLTLLMIGMSWSAAVAPATDTLQTPETENAEDTDSGDPLSLPGEIGLPGDNNEFGYSPDAELLGSRTESAKTYLGEDGDLHVLVSSAPVHYMEDGVWEEINLNLEATPNGWAVTENSFQVYFDEDVGRGVQVVAGDNYDPVTIGMSPMVVMLDAETLSPHPYNGKPATSPIDVGGNVIRYPLLTGIDLDYSVSSTQLKQNLVIRDVPMIPDHFKESGYFGIAETLIIPQGYALFLGESAIPVNEIVMTNQSLAIRHLETGESLFTIPQPMVTSMDVEHVDDENDPTPYFGKFVIRSDGVVITLMTVVETSWLLDEDNRSYPILIDPTLDKGAQRAGWAFYYRYQPYGWSGYTDYYYTYNNANLVYTCRGSGNYQINCGYSSFYTNMYRYAWHRYNFNGAMPTGAVVNSVDFKSNVGGYWGSGNKWFDCTVLKTGGSQSSNMIDPSSYTYSGVNGLAGKIRLSARSCNSQGLSTPPYYFQGGAVRTISMNSNGESDIQDAVDGNGGGSNGHIVGLGIRNTQNTPLWYWCSTNYYSYYGCTTANKHPLIHVAYTGGSDTTPPESNFVPYTGLTTHRAEARTLFFGLKDGTGVDTTSSNGPHVWYRANNGSWSGTRATSLGTCVATYFCDFKVLIPAVNEGDYVQYFLAFQDINGAAGSGTSGNANFATDPSGGSGSPSNPTAPSSGGFNYFVQPNAEADYFNSDGTKNNKWQIKITNVNNFRYYSVYQNFDEQLTYYEDSQEYIWEYDTSRCGTGQNACFNPGSVYNLKYNPSVNSYSYTNCAQVAACKTTEPGLTMNAQNGPQMSTIWYYSAADGKFGMVGLGTSSGIDVSVSGTPCDSTTCTQGGGRDVDDGYSAVRVPGDITMKFGTLSVNATFTSSTSTRNWFCVNSNNHPSYFTSSNSANPYCLYSYTTWQYDRQFNGWQAPGYDGRWMPGASITQKVSMVRPQPDIWPPDVEHGGLMDTYSDADRTVTVGLSDLGEPPSGVNVSSGTDSNGNLEGPHIFYRVYDTTASSWSGWTRRAMTQESGMTRAQCDQTPCDWTASIPGTDRTNSVEYTIHVQDNLNNWANSSAFSYTIGQPTKVFTVEWHDMNCYYTSDICNYQVKMYDVTNEVELLYDPNSNPYYNWESIGYQKGGSTAIGATLQERGPGYVAGVNQFNYNYRIATDGNNHGYERMAVSGYSELYNYNEQSVGGSSTGMPYVFYCMYYWYQYYNQCQTMIDLPSGFDFEWFGTTYSGNTTGKIDAARNGAMAFTNTQSTFRGGMQQMITYYGSPAWYYNNWPELPNTGSFVNRVHIAPWFGAYGAYYCYYNAAVQCAIRTKMVPFEGAGMDVYSDITTPTIWDNEMSPIRIVPSGDYIRVTADLTIEAGVEVLFGDGKGIDIAGACNKLTVTGNSTHRNAVGSIGSGTGLGFAFTNGGCSSANNDDRHVFENVDFENVSIAISAGSRHGNNPHYNGNVGNFSLSDVTFTNVGTAISHGSGQGSGFDLSGVTMSGARDSCVALPDNAALTWIGGGASDCNTLQGSGNGAIDTGTGSSVYLENVGFNGSRVNGVFGEASDLSLSNVTIDASALSGTQAGSAVGQTGSQTSGTSLSLFNVQAPGYAWGLRTHATDDISIDTLNSGGILLAPGGTSATVLGATGYDITDVTSTGNLAMTRTTPSSMTNIDLGGYLEFSGTAAAGDQIAIGNLIADGISVVGCGWSVRADDVTLGGGSAGTWATASCTSSSARSTLTVADGTMSGSSNNGNIVYARNGEVTLAGIDITGQTNMGAYVAVASTNGDVRLIGVTWRGNQCADSNGWTGSSTCWVDVTSSSGVIYAGGFARVAAFRVMNLVPVFVADHAVTTKVVDSSGVDIMSVGTTYTDSTGNASAWLIKDKIERVSGSTVVTDSYTDHSVVVAGGAGQNETGPADAWYGPSCTNSVGSCAMPLDIGDQVYLKLEAFPQDWNGAAKDCAWLATNTSTMNGYYIYTMQLLTLSTNLILDGCKLHLDGTKMIVNHTASQQPTITIKNGGEMLITEGGGEVGAT
ncbi:MAG: hypothetical protein DSY88_10675 [Candidatus Poseidoniales archaeon]|nr:MAG: hypothetical protein DSY88_10675 [Candidatus Poseidoniales archaeon]